MSDSKQALTDEELAGMRVEAYISSLPWSAAATEHEKSLVAGNLRSMWSALVLPLLADLQRLRALAGERAAVEEHADLGPGTTHHGTPGECGCWRRLVARLRAERDAAAALALRMTPWVPTWPPDEKDGHVRDWRCVLCGHLDDYRREAHFADCAYVAIRARGTTGTTTEGGNG